MYLQTDFVSIFDAEMADNIMFKKVTELFSKFGLSQYESYIYIFLAKNERKTASQIYKTLRIPKTETYRILTKLQGRGLVTSSFDHPMTYAASSVNKVMESLINQERNRINDLEVHKQELIDLFHKIPSFGSDILDKNGNQFQILHGHCQINNKIKDMVTKAQTKFLLIGSENEFVQFYQDGIFELLKNSKLDIKILSSTSKKVRHFLQDIKKDCFKIISEKDRRNLCFAIKDEGEIVFFMKNGNAVKEKIAIWSDSIPIVTPLELLFNMVWHNYRSTREAGKYNTLEKTQREYKFKIKELEQENIALTTLNRLLSNNKN